jgi:hypothetical protein
VFDGCIFDRAVHAFNLSVRLGVLDFGEPVLNVVFHANTIKDVCEGIFVRFAVGELDAVIGEYMREFIRHGGNHIAQELCCDHLCLPFM